MPSRNFTWSLLLAVLLAAFSLAGCSSTPTAPDCPYLFTQEYSGNVSTASSTIGQARLSLTDGYAPDFQWRRNDGSLDSLSGHKGKVVLINFWATWCGPCVAEMPAIQSVADEMKDSIFVLSIDEDHQCSPFDSVVSWEHSHNIHFQTVIDSSYSLYFRYLPGQDYKIPESFFIGTNGFIRYAVEGEGDKPAFETYIRNAWK